MLMDLSPEEAMEVERLRISKARREKEANKLAKTGAILGKLDTSELGWFGKAYETLVNHR